MMEKQVVKRLRTQTQVRMGIDEVEQIIVKHLGIDANADFEWRVGQGCVFDVTITATEEGE